MNPTEAITLCRLAKAMCPQQAIDEFTPEAWHLLLEPFGFEDCKAALVEHCRDRPFVAPAEIFQRVKAKRAKRIAEFGPFDAPPSIYVSGDYDGWFLTMRNRIASGELTRANYRAPEIPARREMPAIENVFRTIEETP